MPLETNASKSNNPCFVLWQFILTTISVLTFVSNVSNAFIVVALASSLSCIAIPSSSSIQTISAPEATAFGNISGFKPGVKIKLRLGLIFESSIQPPNIIYLFQHQNLTLIIICLLSFLAIFRNKLFFSFQYFLSIIPIETFNLKSGDHAADVICPTTSPLEFETCRL